MIKRLRTLVPDERGIQHAEEALLLALIAVALTGAVIALKNGVASAFSDASTCLEGTNPSMPTAC